MWKWLAEDMRPSEWHAQRHEDRYSTGIPDISFALAGVDGWLELKKLPEAPKNPDRIFKIPHLLPEQVLWLNGRGDAGKGHSYLLLHTGNRRSGAWSLLHYKYVADLYDGRLTFNRFVDSCSMVSAGRFDVKRFEDLLNG